jgi:hypothetical protein
MIQDKIIKAICVEFAEMYLKRAKSDRVDIIITGGERFTIKELEDFVNGIQHQ